MMAKKPNAICKICGKPYYYCRDCERLGSWRVVACSPECWQEWFARVSRECSQECADKNTPSNAGAHGDDIVPAPAKNENAED